jgi:muramidase (phage lysozyme)
MPSKNLKAFLDVIAKSEGTFGKGDDGYNVMVGGRLFEDYSRHPHPKVWINSINNYSSASGRYQLLYRYWLVYLEKLHLERCEGGSFGKIAQDLCAIQQIKERKALADIEAGRLASALEKVSNIWASLPGGVQHQTTTVASLTKAFVDSGGVLLS